MADDSDDDDDTFVSFGTPVEPLEEDAPRKKPVPIHEQIVTDPQGRRRFHGAFSGGFSAGYFNTVGTKEGWSPSTFVSSRSKKNEKVLQKPEDFMDDEDLSEFGIAPKKIATTGEFLTSRQEQKQQQFAWEQPSSGLKKDAAEKTVIPGVPPLQRLVLPARLSIGVKLLKETGWREGQGIGPRVRRTRKKIYGCAPPSDSLQKTCDQTNKQDGDEDDDIYASGILFAPKDVKDFVFTPKDDLHGLGYKGIDVSSALVQNPVESSLGLTMKRNYFGKASGIKGQAFGVGAFEEEDDDIYITDSMSNYDIELTSESRTRNTTDYHGWTGPPKQKVANGLLSIFTVATKPLAPRQYFPPPVIPKDYKSSHSAPVYDKQRSIQPKQQANKSRLTFAERGRILGETPLPEPKKSVFDFVTSEDRQRLTDIREKKEVQPTKPSQVFTGHELLGSRSSFKPFVKDPQKQERYEQYLRIRAGQKDTSSLPDSGLTEWEREREKEEFARAAMLYKPLSSGMAARFTSAKQPDDTDKVYEEVPAEPEADVSDQAKAAGMKMFGHMTREKFEWHPDRILCKRFNIPDPYPGSREVGVPKVRREKFSLQDFLPSNLSKPVIERHQPPEVVSEKKKEPFPALPSGSSVGLSAPQSHATLLQPESSKLSPSRTADSDKGVKAENQSVEGSEPKHRPPMDLFKAIFADSSSDESKESDSDDEEPVGASDGNSQKKLVTSEENVALERTMPQLESNSFAAQNIEKELSPLEFISRTKTAVKGGDSESKREKLNLGFAQGEEAEHLKFIPRTKSTVEGGEGESEKIKLKGILAASESENTELPLLQFIPRTKPEKEKRKVNPAVSQSEEPELPLLKFIPRTKSLLKEGNLGESEKEKYNNTEDEYGPALPSFSKQAGESITTKRHKKTRKHKKEREIESDSSEDDQRRRLMKRKKIANSSDRSVYASNDIKLSNNSLLENYDGSLSDRRAKVEVRSKRSRTLSFDGESGEKKAYSTSRKSRTENSSNSSYHSSENESSYTKSECGFHDKMKKKKHKKNKRHHDSSSCPEELHYKGKHKKHKRDKKEKDIGDCMTLTEKPREEPKMQTSLNDSKQILAKLKNIQNLREQKRMRAADFM